MARLTWDQVSGPNFSGVSQLLGLSNQAMNQGLDGMRSTITGIQGRQAQSDSNALLMRTMGFQNPDQLRSAFESGELFRGINPANIDPRAMEFVAGYRQRLLGEAQTQAGTGLTAAQTGTELVRPEQMRAGIGLTLAQTQGVRQGNEFDAASRDTRLAQLGANLEGTILGNQGRALDNQFAETTMPDRARLVAEQAIGAGLGNDSRRLDNSFAADSYNTRLRGLEAGVDSTEAATAGTRARTARQVIENEFAPQRERLQNEGMAASNEGQGLLNEFNTIRNTFAPQRQAAELQGLWNQNDNTAAQTRGIDQRVEADSYSLDRRRVLDGRSDVERQNGFDMARTMSRIAMGLSSGDVGQYNTARRMMVDHAEDFARAGYSLDDIQAMMEGSNPTFDQSLATTENYELTQQRAAARAREREANDRINAAWRDSVSPESAARALRDNPGIDWRVATGTLAGINAAAPLWQTPDPLTGIANPLGVEISAGNPGFNDPATVSGDKRGAFVPAGSVASQGYQPSTYAQATTRSEAMSDTARPIDRATGERRSSAYGSGQFVDGTWLEQIRRHRPDLAEGRTDAEILDLRTDRGLSMEMTDRYAEGNRRSLIRSGIPAEMIDDPTLKLAHFAGAGGASALLRADPNTPASQVLDAATMNANPNLASMTAGQVIEWNRNRYNEHIPPASSAGSSPAQQAQAIGQQVLAGGSNPQAIPPASPLVPQTAAMVQSRAMAAQAAQNGAAAVLGQQAPAQAPVAPAAPQAQVPQPTAMQGPATPQQVEGVVDTARREASIDATRNIRARLEQIASGGFTNESLAETVNRLHSGELSHMPRGAIQDAIQQFMAGNAGLTSSAAGQILLDHTENRTLPTVLEGLPFIGGFFQNNGLPTVFPRGDVYSGAVEGSDWLGRPNTAPRLDVEGANAAYRELFNPANPSNLIPAEGRLNAREFMTEAPQRLTSLNEAFAQSQARQDAAIANARIRPGSNYQQVVQQEQMIRQQIEAEINAIRNDPRFAPYSQGLIPRQP